MFIRGGSSLRSNPLPLLCTIFHEKGAPFVYLLLTNGSPFRYLVCNFASLLTAVNALNYKWKSFAKKRLFSRLFKAIKFICASPFGPFYRPK